MSYTDSSIPDNGSPTAGLGQGSCSPPPARPNLLAQANTWITQPRDDVYGAYDHSYMQPDGANQHTQAPIVTGTSVIAIKFSEGVVIAADNLGMSPLLSTSRFFSITSSPA